MTDARASRPPGWYTADSTPGLLRYWTGDAWSSDVPPQRHTAPLQPESPEGIVALGFTASVIGGGLFVFGTDDRLVVAVGALLMAVGGFIAMVGVIAAGVRLGGRWVDYERSHRG